MTPSVLIGFIVELAVSLFDSILCIYFILRYHGVSLKKSKLTIPVILLYYGIVLVGDFIIPGFYTLISVIVLLLSITFSLWVSGAFHNRKVIFRALFAPCIYEIVFILLSSLIYMTLSLFIEDIDLLMQGSVGIARYIYILLHKTSLFAILMLILHVFRTDERMDIRNGILTFLLSLTTILGLGATMTVAVASETAYLLPLFIIVAAFILINIFLYVLLSQIQRLQKSRYELKLLEEKMAFEEERHRNAAAVWENVRKVQHDMKQHLTVMAGHLDAGKPEDCQEYVRMLLPQVEQMGKLIRSDNAVLDYLINSKLCALKDTKVIISGAVGDLSDIRDADLACMIGNVLDNAIEAVAEAEEKRIELLFTKQNENRIIICKNTVRASVLQSNPKLHTTKSSGDAHGLGHQIVEKLVSDYHGMIDYFEEFGMFGVQIILPTPHDTQA
ncbi:MAG: GHKL domain-containing protein [Clostridia bacterium]|nr:GHKL domain-containing protein [Clostridia bacterium]